MNEKIWCKLGCRSRLKVMMRPKTLVYQRQFWSVELLWRNSKLVINEHWCKCTQGKAQWRQDCRTLVNNNSKTVLGRSLRKDEHGVLICLYCCCCCIGSWSIVPTSGFERTVMFRWRRVRLSRGCHTIQRFWPVPLETMANRWFFRSGSPKMPRHTVSVDSGTVQFPLLPFSGRRGDKRCRRHEAG